MNKLAVLAAMSVAFFLCAAPALAADEAAGGAAAAGSALIYLGTAFGCGMIIIGAAYGISKIGSSAVESMARQPEVAGNINTAMIVAAETRPIPLMVGILELIFDIRVEILVSTFKISSFIES